MLCSNLSSTSCLCHLIYHIRGGISMLSLTCECTQTFQGNLPPSVNVTLSHLTDTWHIIRVIFCHGHFSAADKVRLVLHCHWMLFFSHLLTANVSRLYSTPLCATAQLSTLKTVTRYTLSWWFSSGMLPKVLQQMLLLFFSWVALQWPLVISWWSK